MKDPQVGDVQILCSFQVSVQTTSSLLTNIPAWETQDTHHLLRRALHACFPIPASNQGLFPSGPNITNTYLHEYLVTLQCVFMRLSPKLNHSIV